MGINNHGTLQGFEEFQRLGVGIVVICRKGSSGALELGEIPNWEICKIWGSQRSELGIMEKFQDAGGATRVCMCGGTRGNRSLCRRFSKLLYISNALNIFVPPPLFFKKKGNNELYNKTPQKTRDAAGFQDSTACLGICLLHAGEEHVGIRRGNQCELRIEQAFSRVAHSGRFVCNIQGNMAGLERCHYFFFFWLGIVQDCVSGRHLLGEGLSGACREGREHGGGV